MYEKVQYMKIQGPSHVAGTKIKLSYLTMLENRQMSSASPFRSSA